MSDYGIKRDYPLLYEKSVQHDFAERLGGSMDPLMAEIDAALRELHDARRYRAEELERARGGVGYPDP